MHTLKKKSSIFQGKEAYPCLMQGVGWEIEGGVCVKLQFIYWSALKEKPKYGIATQSQSKWTQWLTNTGHLRESQTKLLSLEPSQ